MQYEKFHLPDERCYDEFHFYLRPEGDLFVMGMNDFAQAPAGPIV